MLQLKLEMLSSIFFLSIFFLVFLPKIAAVESEWIFKFFVYRKFPNRLYFSSQYYCQFTNLCSAFARLFLFKMEIRYRALETNDALWIAYFGRRNCLCHQRTIRQNSFGKLLPSQHCRSRSRRLFRLLQTRIVHGFVQNRLYFRNRTFLF